MPADRRPRFARGRLTALGLSGRRREPGRPARFYVGRRGARAEAYLVTRDAVTPLAGRARGGDATFDWGTPSPGTTALAFALLCDATHRRPSDTVVADLAAGLIAGLPADGFVLAADDVHRWLARRRLGPGGKAVVRRARARRWLEALALAQPWPAYPFLVPMAALQCDDGEDSGRPTAAASVPHRPTPLRRRRR